MTKSIRFEFIDLKLFLLVAEHGSLSQAAEAMPLALSAASARIKTLESRLSLKLLERKARGVELTHAGKLFLEHARGLMRAANEAQKGMEAISGKGKVKLNLFSNTTGLSTELPAKLGEFLRDNPDVDVNFEQHSSREVAESVFSGKADLGIVDGDYNQNDLLYLLYKRNELVIIAHPESEQAKLSKCRLKDWLKHPLVGYEKGSSLQKFIDRMSLLIHQSGSYRAFAPDFNSVATLVAENVGVAIVPRPLAERFKERFGVIVVELDEIWANRELHVCIRPDADKNMPALRLARFLTGVSE